MYFNPCMEKGSTTLRFSNEAVSETAVRDNAGPEWLFAVECLL
jgi:hypothetical protein